MPYLWWSFPPLFCSVHYPLTFSFIFVWHLFWNNHRSNSTNDTTEATATEEGKCDVKPLMEYLWWSFPLFFCSVCSPLTFSFIFVWRLFPNNQHRKSTKNRTAATATAKAGSMCRLNSMMAYLLMIVSAVLVFHSLSANLKFHFRLALILKKPTQKQHKKDNSSDNNSRGGVLFEPSDGAFTMSVSDVLLFCLFSTNLHFLFFCDYLFRFHCYCITIFPPRVL